MLGVQRCHHHPCADWSADAGWWQLTDGHSGIRPGAAWSPHAACKRRLGLAAPALRQSGQTDARNCSRPASRTTASAAKSRSSSAAAAPGVARAGTGDRHRHTAFTSIRSAGVHASAAGAAIYPARRRSCTCIAVHASHAHSGGISAFRTAVRAVLTGEPAGSAASSRHASGSFARSGRWRCPSTPQPVPV